MRVAESSSEYFERKREEMEKYIIGHMLLFTEWIDITLGAISSECFKIPICEAVYAAFEMGGRSTFEVCVILDKWGLLENVGGALAISDLPDCTLRDTKEESDRLMAKYINFLARTQE